MGTGRRRPRYADPLLRWFQRLPSKLASFSIKSLWVEVRRKDQRGWMPLSLTLLGLSTFIGVLFCSLVALITMELYATIPREGEQILTGFSNYNTQQGLLLFTSNRYTWTYGPTAVFTLIISFWRLVDFHCKALLPWSELEKRSLRAQHSVLLDYVSPFLVVSLFKACYNRHFIVVLTTAGFIILKLVTVFSTGLLSPADVTLFGRTTDIIQTSRFDNLTQLDPLSDPGPGPFYTGYALLQSGSGDTAYGEYNAPQNFDSTYYVFENLGLAHPEGVSNISFQHTTRAFSPVVNCTAVDAEVVFTGAFSGNEPSTYLPFRVQNDSVWTCPPTVGGENDGAGVFVLDASRRVCPERQLIPSFGVVPCNLTSGQNSSVAHPLLIALSEVRYDQTFNESLPTAAVGQWFTPESWSVNFVNITMALCEISYTMLQLPIVVNSSVAGPSILTDDADLPPLPLLPNLSNQWLTGQLAYVDPIHDGGAKGMFGNFEDRSTSEQPPRTMMKLLTMNEEGDYTSWLGFAGGMASTAEDILELMLLEIVNQQVLRPTNETFTAESFEAKLVYTVPRLQIQSTSFKVMISGLSVMLVLIGATLVLRPAVMYGKSPETILSHWEILARSHDLRKRVALISDGDELICEQHLKQWRYHTYNVNGQVILAVSSDRTASDLIIPEVAETERHYAPLTLRRPVIFVTLSLSPLLIILLELLQRRSNRLSGLFSLADASNFKASFYTRYLPASIALSVATLYNSLDFNAALLAPYGQMRWKNARCNVLREQMLGQLTPLALYTAFKNSYWSAFLTGIAALVGSLLTIIVSGLYTIDNLSAATGTSVSVFNSDMFNFSYQQGNYTDNGTSIVVSLLESLGPAMPWPIFTNDTLAFPKTFLSTTDIGTWNDTASVKAQLPAWRANLSCTELASDTFNVTFQSSQVSLHGYLPLPVGCTNDSQIYLDFDPTSQRSSDGTASVYVAEYVDLPFSDSASSHFETDQNCPTVLVYYGVLEDHDPAQSALTAYVCQQNVQLFLTDVTFEYQGLSSGYDGNSNITVNSVKLSSPSKPMPWRIEEAGIDETTNFSWRIQHNLNSSFKVFNPNQSSLHDADDNGGSTQLNVSSFFQGVLLGRTPLGLEQLAVTDQAGKAQVFDHIQAFYQRYMAQYMSVNMRLPLDGTMQVRSGSQSDPSGGPAGEDAVFEATYTPVVGLPRLVQHRLPTWLLQGMLAMMFICGALACHIGTFHHVVRWNPCTIAGVMALAAGSKMCAPNPPEAPANVLAAESIDTDDEDNRSAGSGRGSSSSSVSEVEMTELRRHGPLHLVPSTNSRRSESSSRENLIHRTPSPLQETTSRAADHWFWDDTSRQRDARFRLGWWDDGTYVHSRRRFRFSFPGVSSPASSAADQKTLVGEATSSDRATNKRQRYGVDVIL